MTKDIYSAPKHNKKSQAKRAEAQKPPAFFHLVAATAYYEKSNMLKQRTVNIMLQTDSPNITRSDLDQVNQGVLSRVNTENDVQADQLKDIVILNVCRLAAMQPEDFYGMNPEDLAGSQTPDA